MNFLLENTIQIEGGLSKKKVYRKFEKKLNKIIIDFLDDKKEFDNFLNVYDILKKVNISIPKLYEVYLDKNILVMQDFGAHSFDKIFEENKLYNLLK